MRGEVKSCYFGFLIRFTVSGIIHLNQLVCLSETAKATTQCHPTHLTTIYPAQSTMTIMFTPIRLSAILVSLFILWSCTASESTKTGPVTYPNASLLLSVEEFAAAIQNPDVIIVDTRTSDSAFTASRIPGAVYLHSRSALMDREHPVEHFMIGAEAFQAIAQSIGLHNQARVLIYDEGNALGSARLFYALEYFGFEGKASILNGGFVAWTAAEMPVASGEAPTPLAGTFASRIQEDRMCDIRTVLGAANDPNVIVFDVRSRDEYDGVDVRAAQGGHIPGAVNLEWSDVLKEGDIPFFRPFEEIEELYASLGVTRDKEVIPHCHTNVRGSHAYFTLRLMGFDSVRAYEGSWSEFGNQ
jgi:thiosulfate/3-mercaptopyruvate sulfurtransferase